MAAPGCGRGSIPPFSCDSRPPIPRFDPYALIFDPTASGLGREAFVLTEHGFEVEVVASLVTAQQWLTMQEGRAGVVLLPAALGGDDFVAVVDALGPMIEGGTRAMVLVGEVLGRSEARQLSDQGFPWLVRSPFTPEELHLGVAAALGASTWADARKVPRVPVSLRIDVARPGGIVPARVCDVSAGGMFLELTDPPPLGTPLMVEMTLGARTMMLRAIVTHQSRRATPGREAGVGVTFDQLDDGDERAIGDYVAARLGSVRL